MDSDVGIWGVWAYLIVLIVLPAWWLNAVILYTNYSTFHKILMVPVCFIAPIAMTLLWPFIVMQSGIIGFSGPGEYQAPYNWYLNELFGNYSSFVWSGITIFIIYGIQSKIKDTYENT